MFTCIDYRSVHIDPVVKKRFSLDTDSIFTILPSSMHADLNRLIEKCAGAQIGCSYTAGVIIKSGCIGAVVVFGHKVAVLERYRFM